MEYANIILEMLERIKKLEGEVDYLKSKLSEADDKSNCTVNIPQVAKRDTSRYMFNGKIYLKNRLVLAVVKDYVDRNHGITCGELKNVFSKSLQGSIGVVESVEVASRRSDYNIRFFAKDDEVIHLCDGDVYVCSQWGILNIPNFIKRAETLNYTIEIIK